MRRLCSSSGKFKVLLRVIVLTQVLPTDALAALEGMEPLTLTAAGGIGSAPDPGDAAFMQQLR